VKPADGKPGASSLEDGAVKAHDCGVVVGWAGRATHVASVVLRTIVAEHGAHRDPLAAALAQQAFEQLRRSRGVRRAHRESDEGESAEAVSAAELVNLAYILELADVEPVHAGELARGYRQPGSTRNARLLGPPQ